MTNADGGRTMPRIAVFARAPIPGQAKTRLIPLLGAVGAAQAHRAMVLQTLRTACETARLAPASRPTARVTLWTADDHDHPFFLECEARFGVQRHAQPGGDLGARMAACLAVLSQYGGESLLIGTDCPALTPAMLTDALDCLRGGAALVFVPAQDGGYVLVGAGAMDAARRQQAFDRIFSGMPWSTSAVMRETRERLAGLGWCAGVDWMELPPVRDVDTSEDYLHAQAAGLLKD